MAVNKRVGKYVSCNVIHKPTGRELTCWLREDEMPLIGKGHVAVTSYWYTGETVDAVNVLLCDLEYVSS